MINEHVFLDNMTLEKPPWGKPVREIDILRRSQANATKRK
jgi:hypothetical protein